MGNVSYIDDEFIEALFFKEYHRVIRYARVLLQEYDAEYIDVAGRAEDVVQEVFYLACEKRDLLVEMESPGKWLNAAVAFKAREAVREDRKWIKCLLLLPAEDTEVPFPELDGLSDLIPKEDYALLRRLYIEGYRYEEICKEFGIKRSNLGMRVNRIKKAFRKKYEKFFI